MHNAWNELYKCVVPNLHHEDGKSMFLPNFNPLLPDCHIPGAFTFLVAAVTAILNNKSIRWKN